MANSSKPLGLTLIALYSAFNALILLPAGCAAGLFGQVQGVGIIASILSSVFILVGLLSCSVVYGLWTLQEWGRSLAYWLYLISVPLGFLAIFPPMAGPKISAGNTIFQLVGIAVDLTIILYLMKPEVKGLFSQKETSKFASDTSRKNSKLSEIKERSSQDEKENLILENLQLSNENAPGEIEIPIKKPAFVKVIDMSTGYPENENPERFMPKSLREKVYHLDMPVSVPNEEI